MVTEPFEPSPFMPAVNKAFDSDFGALNSQQQREQIDAHASAGVPESEKDNISRENNVAKIRVVVCQ